MSWDAIGAVGDFIGGIGVVVTLVYLATQIRQSNTTARAQARQTLIDAWASKNWVLANDPRMLRAFAAGLSRWPDISNEDKTIFDLGMGAYLSNIQNGLLLRDTGLLDSAVFDHVSS